MKVLIPDVLSPPANIEKKIFGTKAEIIISQANNSSEIQDNIWNSVNAVLAFDKIKFDKNLLDKMNLCKVIVRVGVGFDNVDLDYAKIKKITVCNVPDYGVDEVADHAIGFLLMLSRGMKEYVNNVEKRNWTRENDMPIRLKGKNIGIIGLGRIGTAVARRAKVLGLHVIFYDPYIKEGFDKSYGFQKVSSLKELSLKSDFVSIHTPINKETFHLINDSFFSNLKKGSFIINTARGDLIDINSLEKFMKNDVVKGAALDVLPLEPNTDNQKLIVALEKSEPWIKNRIIVTPHVAFYSPESFIEMREKASKEALRVLQNMKPLNPVN